MKNNFNHLSNRTENMDERNKDTKEEYRVRI